MFCDEEERNELPAGEGDVIAYIGYFSCEVRVFPASTPQYLTSVSGYHEYAGYESPTKRRLVARVLKVYPKIKYCSGAVQKLRVGMSVQLVRRIAYFRRSSESAEVIRSFSMVLFAFVFYCQSVTLAHVKVGDVYIGRGEVRARLVRREGKTETRLLIVSYAASQEWGESNPMRLLVRWVGAA